jgi:hypothetical protein
MVAAVAMALAAALAQAAGNSGDEKSLLNDAEMWGRVCDAAERHYNATAADDRLVKLYRHGHQGVFNKDLIADNPNPDFGNVHANLTFAHVNVQRAELAPHQPTITIEPRDNEGGANPGFQQLVQLGVVPSIDAAKRIYADALEDMMNHSYERCSTHEENSWIVQDILTRDMGVTLESFDTARKLDRSDRLMKHEVYVDIHARTTIRQAGYVVHTVNMPFYQAEEFFKPWGIRIEKPNFSLSQDKLERPGADSDLKGENDLFRFQQCWVKLGDKRVLKFRDPVSKQFIAELPVWPCGKLEVDDFPFSFAWFNALGVSFGDAFSELRVIDALRASYERLIRYFDDKTFKSLAPLVLVDESLSPDDIKAMKESRTMDIRRVKLMGNAARDYFALVDLQSPNGPAMEVALMLKQLADEICGLDEILRGALGREGMTAKEASIRDDQSKSRTGLKIKALDRFFNQQLRHRVQICRQRVPIETVQRVCGDLAAMVWQVMAGSLDDLLSEFSVQVGAGSASQNAKRERIDRAERMRQAGHQENQARIAMGMPPKIDTLELLLQQAREDDYRNPERFLLPDPAPPEQLAANSAIPQVGQASPSPGTPAAEAAGGGGAAPVPVAAAQAAPAPNGAAPAAVNIPQGVA